MSTWGTWVRYVTTSLLPEKGIKHVEKQNNYFPILDISVSGNTVIQDGKLIGTVTHDLYFRYVSGT